MSYYIINHLNEKKITRHFVNISAKTVYQNQIFYVPSKLLDWNNGHYHSQSGENQNFEVEFFYSIPYIEKVVVKAGIQRDPYHWKIEGSKDGKTYTDLYVNDGVMKLCEWGNLMEINGVECGCVKEQVNELDIIEKGYFKKIRFVQTGPDSNNQLFLILCAIDFIGAIHIRFPTCEKFIARHFISFPMLILII